MERREDALRDALVENAAETSRWEEYRKENLTAIENLDMFSKRLTVDVMVPVGRKAYIPGQLVHTNEVLVGHYQNYFSKCSAHKAKELCELRIWNAEEQLKKLQMEADLWQNKLRKPYADGVLPNAEEREIIEDYDEAAEKKWREEHRLRVKQTKMQERQHREKQEGVKRHDQVKGREKSDEDILKMLEDGELMEELEKELNNLEVEELNDETLRQLMSGEMELPPSKPRVAHSVKEDAKLYNKNTDKLPGIIKKTELASSAAKVPATNNNSRSNPELSMRTLDNDSDDSAASESEPLLVEVQLIKEQAKFLSQPDQIGFLEYQIQILKQKLLTIPLRNQQGIDEKIHLMAVIDGLEELLELAEEAVGAEELALYAESDEQDKEYEQEPDKIKLDRLVKPEHEKRLSFALEDQTLEFRQNEAVAHMLPKADMTSTLKEPPKRDVIKLDEPIISNASFERRNKLPSVHIDKQQTILSKVEQNLDYFSEHQSEQDFDLVNKILDSSLTLHIHFTHSSQPWLDVERAALNKEAAAEESVPGTPADLYQLYVKSLKGEDVPQPTTLFINGYEGEDEVKTPVLREANRAQAYEDPRLKFSIPHKASVDENVTKSDISYVSKKSILRNKTVVQHEKHILSDNNLKKKKKVAAVHEEQMSAYSKVMHEVVEKPITEPDPLPEGAYIDAHTPKKRVSRYKQMRMGGKQKS